MTLEKIQNLDTIVRNGLSTANRPVKDLYTKMRSVIDMCIHARAK